MPYERETGAKDKRCKLLVQLNKPPGLYLYQSSSYRSDQRLLSSRCLSPCGYTAILKIIITPIDTNVCSRILLVIRINDLTVRWSRFPSWNRGSKPQLPSQLHSSDFVHLLANDSLVTALSVAISRSLSSSSPNSPAIRTHLSTCDQRRATSLRLTEDLRGDDTLLILDILHAQLE